MASKSSMSNPKKQPQQTAPGPTPESKLDQLKQDWIQVTIELGKITQQRQVLRGMEERCLKTAKALSDEIQSLEREPA